MNPRDRFSLDGQDLAEHLDALNERSSGVARRTAMLTATAVVAPRRVRGIANGATVIRSGMSDCGRMSAIARARKTLVEDPGALLLE